MFYLEYEDDTRLVVKIHEEQPTEIQEGHSIATSDNFNSGMELEYIITVDTFDQEGVVTASSTTKQVEPAYQLLKKINSVQEENTQLKNNVADLWEIILMGGM